MASFGGERHLGKMYGLNQGPASPTPLILGSELGYDITTATDRFPRAVAWLQALGWTNTEILQRTYFSMAYNDAVLYGQQVLAANESHDCPIVIPSGRWYYNMELRSGQNRNIGNGCRYNFGTGGTDIRTLGTNWKSIYGAQNNNLRIGFVPWTYCGESNTSVFPLAVGGGTEWCHNFTVEDIYMSGDESDGFKDMARVSVGVMYYIPGEQSGIYRCRFDSFNDFGVLVSHNPADAYIDGCSGFHNKVAIVGVRGCARGAIHIKRLSGDYNPSALRVFRGGSDVFGTGAYLTHALSNNPGGTIHMDGVKIEDSCARDGYTDHTGGVAGSIGKGNILAVLTGRFQFLANNVNLSTYSGKIHSLIEAYDDFGEGFGGIPYNNSKIEVRNLQSARAAYWLHDWEGEKAFELNATDDDSQRTDFFWQANFNSGLAIHPNTQEAVPYVSAAFHGQQPYMNDGQIGIETWDEDLAQRFNYDTVTGANF